MKIIKEFKEFAMRGNMIDLAVGVIVGGAFGKIISSLVNDIIMPPIGLILGGINFSELKLVLKPATLDYNAVSINYGSFFQIAVDFLIIAFLIFLMVKAINLLKRQEKKSSLPSEPSREEKLLAEIRDLLKNQRQ